MKIKSIISVVAIATSMGLTLPALADGKNSHQHGHSDQSSGHMMDKKNMGDRDGNMDAHMREIMGHGRVNKVMAAQGMINIKHEAMPEINWPPMSMNFKAQEQVDLSSIKPGQQVDFKLLVDEDNNYFIKEITVK